MSRCSHQDQLLMKPSASRGRKGNGEVPDTPSPSTPPAPIPPSPSKAKIREEAKGTGKRKLHGEEAEKGQAHQMAATHEAKRHPVEANGNVEGGLGTKAEVRRMMGSRPPKKRGKKKQKFGSFTRRLWNDVEDEAIIELVSKYGIRKWTLISKKLQEEYHIYGRSGKQCRERYLSSYS